MYGVYRSFAVVDTLIVDGVSQLWAAVKVQATCDKLLDQAHDRLHRLAAF